MNSTYTLAAMSMTDQKVLLDQCASSNTPLQPCALVSALKSPNQFHHDVFLFGFASYDISILTLKKIATAVTLEIVSMPSIEWQIKRPWISTDRQLSCMQLSDRRTYALLQRT